MIGPSPLLERQVSSEASSLAYHVVPFIHSPSRVIMTFTTDHHTLEVFLLACSQLEDLTDGANLFEVLGNPELFSSEARDLADYLDCWDCWLFSQDGV